MSTFQLIVTGIFVVLTLIGVGTFAAFSGLGGTKVGVVTIWGTADSGQMGQVLQTMRNGDKSFQDVTYVQKDPSTYDQALVNAIASGNSPDLFLITQEELGTFADKIQNIPYSAVSQAAFTNSFIDEGSVFLNAQGAWALPFTVDPLVMYYNRDLLSTAGIAQAPQNWSDFLAIAPKITSLDSSQNVHTSAVALGTWDNIAHAKAIVSALMMQAGDPIVGHDKQGNLASVFGQTPQGAPEVPAASALRFYTEFANPSKTSYSWNGSLPNSGQAFASGDVAVYFGLASEDGAIAQTNPNLHYGVAVLPQLSGSVHSTYGILTGLAIPRTARNGAGALAIAQKLTGQAGTAAVVAGTGLPPVRRDVGVDTAGSADLQVFAQSALIARGWFDPDQTATDRIFRTMIQSVITGSSDPASAVSEASQEFMGLFH